VQQGVVYGHVEKKFTQFYICHLAACSRGEKSLYSNVEGAYLNTFQTTKTAAQRRSW
jgi:hypothetical protein